MRLRLLFILLFALPTVVCGESLLTTTPITTTTSISKAESAKVDRIGGDLVSMHKGEYTMSVTASFGSFSNTNSNMLLLLNNLDASGSISSIKPSVGYFYSDHSMIGARFKYTNIEGEISSASLDFGEVNDLVLDMPYISIKSKTHAYGLYHRSYTKLDRKGNFELFSEIEVLYSLGDYHIAQDITFEGDYLRSNTSSINIGFNPGLAVNVTPNVATFVSFGLGGFSYNKVKQYDADNNYIGMRQASQLSLNIDLFAISFGVAFHFWHN